MKRRVMTMMILVGFLPAFCQQLPPTTEQQLENNADIHQEATEDDSYVQSLEHFKKHPLNINEADDDELRELNYLSDLQIDNLEAYRDLLGDLVSIYELQAVPAWDISTIRKILPFITVNNNPSVRNDLRKRFKAGDQNLLIRFSETPEKSAGFKQDGVGTKYLGSSAKIFFRYRYQYKNLLQFGVAGDKDAGEQFFKGSEKAGFDFYSFHLFARKFGRIQALAIGDFTVNLGQGLIQWQSLAFSKSGDVVDVKRQSAILRPYSSSGEFYFQRGLGVTFNLGRVEATGFVSFRKLSSTLSFDSIHHENIISSFQNSGYHRTQSEIDDRNNLNQFAVGGNVSYKKKNWHIGLNAIAYQFSLPILKKDEPYNVFAISGKKWNNFSLDYAYTIHNLHFFGEGAVDKNLSPAFINGLLISLDPKIDLALVHRRIDQKYQAVYGDAFTENSYPTNEHGFYSGISVRPAAGWKFGLYADVYEFPWLKYQIDAPGRGKDFLSQVIFTKGKELEIDSRFRVEIKQANLVGGQTATNYLVDIPRQSWRTQINLRVNPAITLRQRIELAWYDSGSSEENGFLSLFDILYKPQLKSYSGNIRWEYFETDSYNSRVYAFENSVLYTFSIPAFFGKGYRYYININYDMRRNLSIWVRFAQTRYLGITNIGSDLDQIPGKHRSDVNLEIQWSF